MRFIHVFPMVCAAALAGCGGDGGGNPVPDPATGILEAGNVKGLRYRTDTQSGTTGANGAFTYLPGEIVTFSIGGVKMGAAPGAAKISLFTLAGVTPPMTELALRRELDRAGRYATKMTCAMNLAHFLIALDADNDPDNGIDLSGRDSQLASTQIDFGVGVFAFANRLERLVPDLTRNIPTWRSLTFLYAASNLQVAAHSPVRYDAHHDFGLQFSTTVSYFPNGALSGEVTGPSLLVVGLGGSSSAYTYDSLGRLSTRVFENINSPFEAANLYRSVYTYDVRGNEISAVVDQEAPVGVLSRRNTVTGTPDAHGRFPAQTSTEDSDGDGVIDSRTTTLRTFDTRGNPLSTVVDNDTNADGRSDYVSRFTDSFDASDHLRTELYESDSNGDGVTDSRTLTTYEPPANGAVEWDVVSDFDVDGIPDERSFHRATYDSAGNQIAFNSHEDHGADDTAHSRVEFLMTYDSERRRLSRVAHHDFEADGVVDQTEGTTYVYDVNGALLSVDRRSDAAAPFGIAQQLVTYEYGTSGERTSWRSRLDIDGDGVFEFDVNTQVTSQEFTDGVLMLGYQYFEGSDVVVLGGGVILGGGRLIGGGAILDSFGPPPRFGVLEPVLSMPHKHDPSSRQINWGWRHRVP